jgi:acetyl esterase/lipase
VVVVAHGDPGWITLVGNSAGAATGAVVALAGDDFEGDCFVTDASALLDALVAFEGPYDYATTVYNSYYDHTILKDEDPELWEAINPYSHIGRNPDLQVRLVYGDDADVAWYDVLPEVSIEFHQALADAGYDVELILVEGAVHNALGTSYSDAFAVTVQ